MPVFHGTPIDSPLMLGTAGYPSPKILAGAFARSGAGIATVSLRREAGGGQDFWALIRSLGVVLLPNAAGCHGAREAVTTAHMAREAFGTDWIKPEVIGHTDTLQPDVFELVQAARILGPRASRSFPTAPRIWWSANACWTRAAKC